MRVTLQAALICVIYSHVSSVSMNLLWYVQSWLYIHVFYVQMVWLYCTLLPSPNMLLYLLIFYVMCYTYVTCECGNYVIKDLFTSQIMECLITILYLTDWHLEEMHSRSTCSYLRYGKHLTDVNCKSSYIGTGHKYQPCRWGQIFRGSSYILLSILANSYIPAQKYEKHSEPFPKHTMEHGGP